MLVGHQKQWQFLEKSYKLGKIPHAYLFYGQESIGKKTMALEFIKLLNCQGSEFQPCGTCRSCQDIEKKAYPDLLMIEPEEKEIKIAQIRRLHSHLALRAYSAPFKSVMIDEAHCLNQDAQSAFLKILEEPKGKTIFILITEMPERLLKTMLSRVEVVKFYPVPENEIEDYLRKKQVPEKKLKEIVSLSSGKPGRAIDFLANPQKQIYQQERIKEILTASKADLAWRFQYAKELSKEPQNLTEILDIWLRFFREKLLASVGQDQSSNKDYSIAKLKKILRTIQSTNFLISTTNANPRLALEILMLEL